jgi:hypothetical protein
MGKNFTLYEIIFLYAFNQLEISKQGSSLRNVWGSELKEEEEEWGSPTNRGVRRTWEKLERGERISQVLYYY